MISFNSSCLRSRHNALLKTRVFPRPINVSSRAASSLTAIHRGLRESEKARPQGFHKSSLNTTRSRDQSSFRLRKGKKDITFSDKPEPKSRKARFYDPDDPFGKKSLVYSASKSFGSGSDRPAFKEKGDGLTSSEFFDIFEKKSGQGTISGRSMSTSSFERPSRPPRSFDRNDSRTPRSFERNDSRSPRSFDRNDSGPHRSFDRNGSRPPRSFDRNDSGPHRSFDRNGSRPPRSFDRDDSRPSRSFDRGEFKPRRSFDKDDSRPPRSFDRDDSRPSRSFDKDDSRPPRSFDKDDSRPPRSFDRDDFKPRRSFDSDNFKPRRSFDSDDSNPRRSFDRNGSRPPRSFDRDGYRPPRSFDRNDSRPTRTFEKRDSPRTFDKTDSPGEESATPGQGEERSFRPERDSTRTWDAARSSRNGGSSREGQREGRDARPRERRRDERDPIRIPRTNAASQFLYGQSIVETVLKETRRTLFKMYLYCGENRQDPATIVRLERQAEQAGIAVVKVFDSHGLRVMDKMSEGRPHNGCIIEASPIPQLPLKSLGAVVEEPARGFNVARAHQSLEEAQINGISDFIESSFPPNRKPFFLLLDQIQDPGNLGAILRSAAFLGVNAVGMTSTNSASLTSTAIKAAAGASEVLNLFNVVSILDFLTRSKEEGWVIYAAVAPTSRPRQSKHLMLDRLDSYDPLSTTPTILVVGSEGEGLTNKTKRMADYEVSIPNHSENPLMDSLNVSVATGILCSAFLKKQHTDGKFDNLFEINEDVSEDIIEDKSEDIVEDQSEDIVEDKPEDTPEDKPDVLII